MANGSLSFVSRHLADVAGVTQAGPAAPDPSARLVEELLARLQAPGPQPPQRPGTARRIIGALGDALLAAGAARQGQQAPTPGPFLRGIQQRETTFQAQQAEFEEQRIRTLQALAALQARTEQQEVMNQMRKLGLELQERRTNRPTPREFVRDVEGQPRRIRQLLDATGEIVDELDLGPAFVPPVVVPGVPEGGQPTLGTVRRSTGEFRPVSGPSGEPVAPIPPPGAVDAASKQLSLQDQLTTTRTAFAAFIKKRTDLSRIGTSAALSLPFGLGEKLDEFVVSRTDPEASIMASQLNNIADILLRLRSGAQINEAEFRRLRALLPKLGEGAQSALGKFDRFQQELNSILRVKAQAQPQLFSDEILAPVGLSRTFLFGGDSAQQNEDDAMRILREIKGGE